MVGSEPQVTAALSSPMSFSSFFIVFVFMYFQTIFHKCYVFNISLIVSHIQLILPDAYPSPEIFEIFKHLIFWMTDGSLGVLHAVQVPKRRLRTLCKSL